EGWRCTNREEQHKVYSDCQLQRNSQLGRINWPIFTVCRAPTPEIPAPLTPLLVLISEYERRYRQYLKIQSPDHADC
ncbi:hypothetical protein J6590_032241, partial [Homalodisca vitripennis]